MKGILWGLALLLFYSIPLSAQESKIKEVQVTGMVMDMNGLPLKGALIFVDSIKTKSKTNKKGIYRLKLNPNAKLLTAYFKDFGLLSMEYTGQKKISFLYKSDDIAPLEEEDLGKMGFNLDPNSNNDTSWYVDFPTILDILDKRFFFAKVTDGKVKIGKGTNSFTGDADPLVFLDGQRVPIGVLSTIPTSDVKLIRVIHNGSEASQYGGLQAANGVILITLKKKN